jgi:hypothetical protein
MRFGFPGKYNRSTLIECQQQIHTTKQIILYPKIVSKTIAINGLHQQISKILFSSSDRFCMHKREKLLESPLRLVCVIASKTPTRLRSTCMHTHEDNSTSVAT